MSRRALFVCPMDYGANPGVDAITHGLDNRLREDGTELEVAFADFRRPDAAAASAQAIDSAVAEGFAAIVIYVLDPLRDSEPAGRARSAGVPVFAFERPRFAVDGALVYPNFNQGAYMADHLASLLPVGGRIAVIGGPEIGASLGALVSRRLGSGTSPADELVVGPIGRMIDASNLDDWKPWSERIRFHRLTVRDR